MEINFINGFEILGQNTNDFNDNDDSCEKGSDEKCKTCSNNIKGNKLLYTR